MSQSSWVSALIFSQCLLVSLSAKAPQEPCPDTTRPMRVTVRHIEANGIGYQDGYTTLEGFFSPPSPYKEKWLPFADLRGHVFNNGKMAANTGIGIRYLQSSRLWGANAYYDYRNTRHTHYNQVAFGLETLGKLWDAKINGYLPVGSKISPYYGVRFSHFTGHTAYLSYKQEYALKGINAEAGYHVDHFQKVPLYFAAGPYYLAGQGHNVWGGQLRVAAHLLPYVKIEGNTSYDNAFRWIGQGQISLTLPFGGKKAAKAFAKKPCSSSRALHERLRQGVDRFEIIPTATKKEQSPATNPLTSSPWVFWFVSNTSHSLGTWESPYPTLAEAQSASQPYQAIYVLPGDGTATGLNQGIHLQEEQWFLGAATDVLLPTTLGPVLIPAQASFKPLLTASGDIVTLANHNVVSGFSFQIQQPNTHGLIGSNVSYLTALSNDFVSKGVNNTNGIYLTGASSGDLLVDACSFDGFTYNSGNNGNGIYIDEDVSLNQLTVQNSRFSNLGRVAGKLQGNGILNLGTITTLTAVQNNFSTLLNSGIRVKAANRQLQEKPQTASCMAGRISRIQISSNALRSGLPSTR